VTRRKNLLFFVLSSCASCFVVAVHLAPTNETTLRFPPEGRRFWAGLGGYADGLPEIVSFTRSAVAGANTRSTR
jgi:hypothetical protein